MKSRKAALRHWSPSLLLAFAAFACNPSDPPVVIYGASTDPIPTGATVIGADEFFAMESNGQLRTITKGEEPKVIPPGTTAPSDGNPLSDPGATAGTAAAGTNNADPVPGDPRIRPVGNDHYAFRVVDRLGRSQEFLTFGSQIRQAIIAAAAEKFPSRDNQLEIYTALRERMSGHVSLSAFPDPSALANLDAAAIARLNTQLSSHWNELATANAPQAGAGVAGATGPGSSGQSVQCEQEQGFGKDGDRVGADDGCATYRAGGLQALYSYPAKGFQTCVKNQGARGTCVAFATTSVIEMAVSQKYGKRVNLSEQDLYFHAKLIWPGSVGNYGDGLGPDSVFSEMMNTGYSLPFESAWDYNVSYSRQDNKDLSAYADSCDGYSENCSDTVHQGKFYCAIREPNLYCGYASPAASGSGYSVHKTAELWDASDSGNSLNKVLSMASSGTPLEMAFSVTSDFYAYDANGYDTFTPNVDQKSVGGHAVHLVGFVRNADLATLAPNAPQGAGGGYIIIKNSWGNCWGDGGYVYLPFDWMKKYVWSVTALTSLN